MNLTRAYRIILTAGKNLSAEQKFHQCRYKILRILSIPAITGLLITILLLLLFTLMSGGDQYVGVSLITSDILFEDLEIKSPEEDFRKPPNITNPLSTKK